MDYEQKIPERYRIFYDRTGGTFKILDTWHESIKNLPESAIQEFEIPDDSPAIKILNSLEVNSLVGQLDKMGWHEKYTSFTSSNLNFEHKPTIRNKTVEELAIENIKKIAEIKAEEGVSKEAILAIRSIIVK